MFSTVAISHCYSIRYCSLLKHQLKELVISIVIQQWLIISTIARQRPMVSTVALAHGQSYSKGQHCTVLKSTAHHCTVLQSTREPCTAQCSTAQYCTVLQKSRITQLVKSQRSRERGNAVEAAAEEEDHCEQPVPTSLHRKLQSEPEPGGGGQGGNRRRNFGIIRRTMREQEQDGPEITKKLHFFQEKSFHIKNI